MQDEEASGHLEKPKKGETRKEMIHRIADAWLRGEFSERGPYTQVMLTREVATWLAEKMKAGELSASEAVLQGLTFLMELEMIYPWRGEMNGRKEP